MRAHRYQKSLLLLSELNLSFKQSYELLQAFEDIEALCFVKGTNDANKRLAGMLTLKQQIRWQQIINTFATSGFAKHETWLQDPQVNIIDWHHAAFPKRLKNLQEGPGWLWLWGNADLLNDPGVAMVGGRYASASGIALAGYYGRALAGAGLTIISGLALGVDGASHKAALDVGGDTIAVLGSGLGCIYPAQHSHFAQQIVQQGGCIVSPWPLFKSAVPYQFPARNRIVSGLSLGVLIIEAAKKSGSLITARAALEQGVDVFALPANPHNKKAEGNLRLIQDGAMLVYEPQQIIAELAPQLVDYTKGSGGNQLLKQVEPMPNLDANLQQLLDVLGYEPTPVDIICARMALSYGDIAQGLMELTLQGYLSESPQGYERIK